MNQPSLVFLSSESFTSFVLYSKFLAVQAKHVAGVFEFPYLEFSSERKRERSFRILRKSSITYFLFKFLTVVVYRPVAKFFGRDLRSFCRSEGIPYHDCRHGMTEEVLNQIRSIAPDVIFNASALILTQDLLNIPKVGCVSFHGARLPEFRGAANYFWVLVEGVSTTRGTLHFVERGLDTGPIIDYGAEVEIRPGTSVFDIYLAVLRTGFDLLNKNFEKLKRAEALRTTKQDQSIAVMRSLPRAADVAILKARGFSVLSFIDIWRMIEIVRKGTH